MGEIKITIEVGQFLQGMQLAPRIKDSRKGKDHIDHIGMEGDPAVTADLFKETGKIQRGIDFLEIEITDIPAGGPGNNASPVDDLVVKMNGDVILDPAVLKVVIIFLHFLSGIFQRIVCDLQ